MKMLMLSFVILCTVAKVNASEWEGWTVTQETAVNGANYWIASSGLVVPVSRPLGANYERILGTLGYICGEGLEQTGGEGVGISISTPLPVHWNRLTKLGNMPNSGTFHVIWDKLHLHEDFVSELPETNTILWLDLAHAMLWLSKSKKVLIEIPIIDNNPIVFEFDLSGSSAALGYAQAKCRNLGVIQ